MNNKHAFYPFTLSTHDGMSSLLLTDLKWDAFEKEGFLGNGHDWNRMIENLCKEKLPSVLPALVFDSEADMFCVRCQEEKTLMKIVEMVSCFYDNESLLLASITQYAQYE